MPARRRRSAARRAAGEGHATALDWLAPLRGDDLVQTLARVRVVLAQPIDQNLSETRLDLLEQLALAQAVT